MAKNTRPSAEQMFQNMIGRQERQPEPQPVKHGKKKAAVSSNGTIQVTVRLRPDQHRQLKEEAFRQDRDMSDLVRTALDHYFEN